MEKRPKGVAFPGLSFSLPITLTVYAIRYLESYRSPQTHDRA
jgi:hypothetical protein